MNPMTPAEILADVMRLLYTRGLVQVKGGNASIIDRDRDTIYITPSGHPRHLLEAEHIAAIDLQGNTLYGNPSSEWRLHLAIYKRIPEVMSIVHAHPPYTIALGELGGADLSLTTEASYRITCISIIPPLKPGTWELAEETAKTLKTQGCNTAILRRHGVVAYSSKDPYHALDAIEALEDLAKIQITIAYKP